MICPLCGGSGTLLKPRGPIRDWFEKCPLCRGGVIPHAELQVVVAALAFGEALCPDVRTTSP